jgi:Fe-S-cluster containining protein
MKKNRRVFKPPCDECGAKCCEYTAIEIGKPSTKTDYDNIRWYLSHENVFVFVDHDRKWHVEFRARCEHLSADRNCRIYENRPRICRRHGMGQGECEYYDSPYILRFSSLDQFEEYLSKKGIDWRFREHGT